MDELHLFLDTVRGQGSAPGRFRGLLHVLVGRRVTKADGTVVSAGMTWRDLATLLKRVRWDKEAVRELGIDPSSLPPRDREKYWYATVSRAGLTTLEARQAGDALAAALQASGYSVSAG